MMRSLFSGVSGLRNHQLKMDVIGNNIANINTVGFKAGRARFAEAFSQSLQAASPGSGTRGAIASPDSGWLPFVVPTKRGPCRSLDG